MTIPILDFLSWVTGFVWLAVIFLLTPCAFFNKTRIFSATGFLICSFYFGLYLWLCGFFITYAYWGLLVLFFGLVFFGIGVIPLAFIALLITNGLFWALLFLINIPIIWVFKYIAGYLFLKHSEKKYTPHAGIIEVDSLEDEDNNINLLNNK